MSDSVPKLIILGSSAGRASAHRASSSYLLDSEDEKILIDCGDGATRNFLQAGHQPESVNHILISHTHADHVCGLSYFIQQRYLSKTDRPLTIHCPTEAVEPIQMSLRSGYLPPERMPFEIHYEPLGAARDLLLGGIAITPYPTTHLASHAGAVEPHGDSNRCECFAFRVLVNGIAIVYSADLGGLSDLDQIQDSIDWLLIESSHIDFECLWPWAEERRISRIILTHLSDDFDSGVTAAAPKYTAAAISIAEDGMTLPVI